MNLTFCNAFVQSDIESLAASNTNVSCMFFVTQENQCGDTSINCKSLLCLLTYVVLLQQNMHEFQIMTLRWYAIILINTLFCVVYSPVRRMSDVDLQEAVQQLSGAPLNSFPDCFVCGPPPMIELVIQGLLALGIPQSSIHSESWWH